MKQDRVSISLARFFFLHTQPSVLIAFGNDSLIHYLKKIAENLTPYSGRYYS